jgi:lysozyme
VNEQLAALYVLIRRFEGCRLRAYICPAGVWTIGWGATGRGVFPGAVWTQSQADARLYQDAQVFVAAVLKASPSLTGGALCAIADFAYNLGAGAYRGSTLRRCIDAGDMEGAKRQLARWVHGGGRVLPGLVLRRAAESALL